MRYILILIILSTSISGCDVPGRLIIKNRTQKTVIVNLSSFPSGVQPIDMRKIILSQQQPKTYFIYGFGGFSEDDLKELQQSLIEVQILTANDTITIRDREELDPMLPKRRKGIFHSVMKIRIKEP